MKKFNFAKIVSLVFVCAMLLCALAVTALANDEPTEPTVAIVSNNVFFGEKYQLMFAVNAPVGADVTATVNGKEVDVDLFEEEPKDNDGNIVADYSYIIAEGVAAQAIDTVVTLTVEYNGEKTSSSYSVLQYVYERLNLKNIAQGTEKTMLESFLAFANAANEVIDKESVSFNDYVYVTVVGGTIDGNNTTGMFLPGATPFENIEGTLDYDSATHHVEWDVTVGDTTVHYDDEAIKTLSVANSNMTITAVTVKNACIHDWADATCTTPKTCTKCGETDGEALGHTWGAWEVTTPATCSKDGEQTRTCTVCETATDTETIKATGVHADTNNDGKCDGCGGVIVISYTLVTDVNNLQAGDKVIIVAAKSNVAMSTTQNTNNRGQVAVTKNEDTVSFTTAVQILTIEVGTTDGTLAFHTGSGYLYAASSSKNYLKTETKLSDNSSWSVSIAAGDGVATVKSTGSNTNNWMRYNSQSSIFSCYGSGQADIVIYEQSITVTCAHETLENVTRVEPTCTEKGSESGTCAECGEPVVKEIAANGHTEETVLGYDATCAEDGLTDGIKCSVCNETLKAQETIPATGEHNDGDSDGFCDECSEDMNSDEAKADKVLVGIEAPATSITEAGSFELDITNNTGYDATITWKITGGTNTGSNISGNILTVVLNDSATTIELTVTVTVGEFTKTETYTLNVNAAPVVSQPVTVGIDIGDYGASQGWTNQTKYTSFTVDGVKFVVTKGGSNTGKYYTTNSGSWRMYSSESAKFTITAPEGKTITSIKITWSEGGLKCGNTQMSSGTSISTSGNLIEISATAKTFITAIEVTYE